jgi:hypothetical protein
MKVINNYYWLFKCPTCGRNLIPLGSDLGTLDMFTLFKCKPCSSILELSEVVREKVGVCNIRC